MYARRYISKRHHRKYRLRFKIRGTADRPRLSVFRSARHIYAQVIDDDTGRTLVSASTRDPALVDFEGNKVAAARKVGDLVVKRALTAGVTKLVFDRNGFLYTGRVAALSKAAHKSGLLSRAGASAKAIAKATAKPAQPEQAPAAEAAEPAPVAESADKAEE